LRNNSLSIAVTWHINIGLAIMADNDLAGGVEQSMKGMEQSLKDGAVQLKEGAAQLAEQQKKTGARQLSGIAGAVHAAAEQLEQQLPGAATYVHDAAERIDIAVLLIPALVILLHAAIMGLIDNGTDPTIAALIVGGAALLIGIVIGLVGWSWVKPASLVPDKTIDQLKRDALAPRHSDITMHSGETGEARSERMVGEERAYGDRNRAA
jgi:Putative Actinobacterial Holin-X, holin superfamily III